MIKTLKTILHPDYEKGLFKKLDYKESVIIKVAIKEDFSSSSYGFIELEIIQTIKREKVLYNEIVNMNVYSPLNHALNPNNLDNKALISLIGNRFYDYSIF